METKNVLIISIAIILCVAIVGGAYAYLNTSSDSNSNVNTNDNSVQSEDSNLIDDILSIGQPSLEILNTTISTGHTLDAKTYTTLNVKAENLENVNVAIIYSRDGNQLASEEYNCTIDNNSNIKIESKDSFKKYPDKVDIKIFTIDGKLLNSVTISLATDDSVQVAEGNGTVTAKSITRAQHSAASANYDSGAFYSEQAGRTIYTGEVQLAPDDHHWKHLGNNEWVRID